MSSSALNPSAKEFKKSSGQPSQFLRPQRYKKMPYQNPQHQLFLSSVAQQTILPNQHQAPQQPTFLKSEEFAHPDQIAPVFSVNQFLPSPSIVYKSISLYPSIYQPKTACKKKLTQDEIKNRSLLLEKKIQITLNATKSFQMLDTTLGSISVNDFIRKFHDNLKKAIYENIIRDIRLVGSGANTILFSEPKEDLLKDIDIVFYLNDIPNTEIDTQKFLDEISNIFILTLASFVKFPSEMPDEKKIAFLQANYLNNRKVVIDSQNKWLIIGFGSLDFRINIKSKREYTSSIYSHQISLLDDNAYCLYGSFEEAKKHFEEKKLVLPDPKDIPNGLTRVLYELTRHLECNIDDISSLCEKYLEDNEREYPVEKIINLLSLQVSKRPIEAQKIHALSVVLTGIGNSKIIPQERKKLILSKTIQMLHDNLLHKTDDSFENKLNEVIIELFNQKFFEAAYTILKIFHFENPKQVKKAYLHILSESAKHQIISSKEFKAYLELKDILEKQEKETLFLELGNILRKNKSFEYLHQLGLTAANETLFENNFTFYLEIINQFLKTNKIELLRYAKDLFLKTYKLFPQDIQKQILDELLDRYLLTSEFPCDLIRLALEQNNFYENKTRVFAILNKIFQNKESKEILKTGYLIIQKLRKLPLFLNLSSEEKETIVLFYEQFLSMSNNLNNVLYILKDLHSHPILSKNNKLIISSIKMLSRNAATISFETSEFVLDYLSKLLKNLSICSILIRNSNVDLQNIIFSLLCTIARKISKETNFEIRKETSSKLINFFKETKKLNIFNENQINELILEIFSILATNSFDDTLETFIDLATLNLSLSEAYLTLAKKIYKEYQHRKDKISHKDIVKLIQKANENKLINSDEWKQFINDFLLTYEPTDNQEQFKLEFHLFNQILNELNFDDETISSFYTKFFINDTNVSFKDKMDLIVSNLPFIKNKTALAKVICKILDSTKCDDLFAIFMQYELILNNFFVNKEELSKIYLSALKKLYKLYLYHKDEAYNKNIFILIQKANKENLLDFNDYKQFVKDFLSTYELSDNPKEFKEEFLLFYQIINKLNLNSEDETISSFYTKLFVKNLDFYLNDGSELYLSRAFKIIDKNPTIKNKLLLILVKKLEELSKKSPQNQKAIKDILTILRKYEDSLEFLIKTNQKEIISILDNLKINSQDSLDAYLEIINLLTAHGMSCEMPKNPIDYLSDKINKIATLDDADLDADEQTKQLKKYQKINEATKVLTSLHKSNYWNSKSFQKEKFELMLSMLEILSQTTSQAAPLYLEFFVNDIENSKKIFSKKEVNPWIDIDAQTSLRFHQTLVNWLQFATSNAKKNIEDIRTLNCYYNILCKNKLNKYTSTDQKKEILKFFYNYFTFYENDDHKIHVQLYIELFMTWLIGFANLYQQVTDDDIIEISFTPLTNFYYLFNHNKKDLIKEFYSALDRNVVEAIDAFLRKTCNLSFDQIKKDHKGELNPPQIIIQTIIKNLFPKILKNKEINPCFKELWYQGPQLCFNNELNSFIVRYNP